MKTIFIIILLLLVTKFVVGQTSKADTLKEKYAWTVTLGNSVKGRLGTTFLGFGYSPNRHMDFYVAPSWGIFTGGTAIFCGSKINIFSKYKLFFNAELTYRHSSRTVVNYENHDSGGQESYYIPPSDYLLTGIGINYRKIDKQNESGRIVFNVTINYNLVLGNKHFQYLNGPFSKDGEDGASRKLAGGLGFTVSFAIQLWRDKKKNK
jgi:hypothetical protein